MRSSTKSVSRVLVSPRLTPEHLESLVTKEAYHNFPGTRVTVCCLSASNGHDFVGVSICAENSKFNIETGKRIARGKAMTFIMDAERYLLRQRLFESRKDKK